MDERCVVLCIKPYSGGASRKGLLGDGIVPVFTRGRAAYVVQASQGRTTRTSKPMSRARAEKLLRKFSRGR